MGRIHQVVPRWPKLTIAGEVGTYLIAAAHVGIGPSNDCPLFVPVLRQSSRHVHFDVVLADAGYDSERNHRYSRERMGSAAVIKLNRRKARHRWPPTPYRREMRRAFPQELYRRRGHVESVFSALKRRLGSALRATGERAQKRECLWRVLAFDLMILRRAPSAFQRSRTDPNWPLAVTRR